jgi:hypothetical protein
MNSSVIIHFFDIKDQRTPYIHQLINYEINDTEGFFYFDGHYYVENKELPKRLIYSIIKNNTVTEDENYEIEVYKRVFIDNIDKEKEIDDEDGSTMKICFFPLYEQKIYFKVIERFDNPKDLFKRLDELS